MVGCMNKRTLTIAAAWLAALLALAGCGGNPHPEVLPTKDEFGHKILPTREIGHDRRVIYLPTEAGRSVVCVDHGGTHDFSETCDWAGYHARYGPGDPFDQES
jgi:hypothetical protein